MSGRFAGFRTSLLFRIMAIEALTLLGACIVLPLLTMAALRGSAETIQADLMRGQAEALARGLVAGPGGGWRLAIDPTLRPIYDTGYDGRAYAVVDAAGHTLLASRFANTGALARAPGRGPRGFAAGQVVGYSLPVAIGGATLRVIVTQDQAGPGAVVDDVIRVFLARYLGALVAFLVVMQLLGGLLLWQSFHRLRRVAHAAGAIGPRSLAARLPIDGIPAEAAPLIHAFNALLARVQVAFHQQDEFAGNVAHELKTPLATLRLHVGEIADPGLRARLVREIERIAHAIAQLRDLAALEHAEGMQRAPIDLGALVVARVADMTPRVLASGHTIAVGDADCDAIIEGNAALIGMAIANLIENATLHTPAGCHIEVTVDADGFTVRDDGPGIAEDDLPRLVRRFHRADHARSDGAGLGLAIVQRIADAHRARLEVCRAEGSGTHVALTFPIAAPQPCKDHVSQRG